MAEFERTFDNAAREYDAVRPEYPEALYQDIFRYQPVHQESRVLEIGMGTGKATGPVLKTGCHFLGLEPGENLGALAKKRLGGYGNFCLRQARLQDFQCPAESFDLIYAATAFHWIPQDYGYQRVYQLLKPGGAFARFAYHAGPDEGRQELTAEIYQLYRRYMHGGKGQYRPFTLADGESLAREGEKYGFSHPKAHVYQMKRDFSPEKYMELLKTYRDHMALEPELRDKLFTGIFQAIQRHGGTMTVYYTVDLELMRKPG